MNSGAEVLIENDGGVRILTLNRPDRLNALTSSIMQQFLEATTAAAKDTSVGCLVVTGAGRGFCSGGDLRDGRDTYVVDAERGGRVEQHSMRLRKFMDASRLLHVMPKPTIAMINGPVAGAGIGIAGACDLRFAAESASFSSAFDRIGASGDFGSTWFWTKILGSGVAREIFMLGEKFTAEQARNKGIYTRVFADEDLRNETLAVAQRLAQGSRTGWRYMKANLNLAQSAQLEQVLDQEAMNMALCSQAAREIHKAKKDKQGDEPLRD